MDWHSWGPEAIRLAGESDRPIFLSIGYSTCYWCHVMERECFEDESIAGMMNRGFVNVKVDREQRPDVDELYMTACQVFSRLTTGRASGGWPLSAFLDPTTLEPFYVGTYFPPTAAHGRPSFPQVLEAMSTAWQDHRDDVRRQSGRVAAMVRESLLAGEAVRPLGAVQVDSAIDQLMSMHDREHGGFGSAPKFPQPVFLEFLMEAGAGRAAIESAVAATLDAMALGGICDQLGGGFHRYSVDERWLVPHFEKMLYDNAQLASVYARSHARTGSLLHRRVVEETLEYVLRELTDPGTGLFHSAQDAEVDAREGLNYLWTESEFARVLREAGLEDDVPEALALFGLAEGTNFQDPHHPEDPPANVLFLPGGLAPDGWEDLRARVRPVLHRSRMDRDQPGLDDKVITGWNGLMIRGLADGGRLLGRPDFVDAAERAARAVLAGMRTPDGELMRTSRGGAVSVPAFLEDHAFLARGLLALHEATNDPGWLAAAEQLVGAARQRFWGEDGAWYDTRADQPDLFVRSRNLGDGALPCAIGTMLLVLEELHQRTGEARYLEDLASALQRLSGSFAANPVASIYATLLVHRGLARFPDRLPDGTPSVEASPVELELPPDPIRFDEDGRATARIRLRIDPGFHVNAHDPGHEELIGLTMHLRGGTGLEASVDYPPGSLYRESVRVHARSLELPVRLQRTGPLQGPYALSVRWQACTDERCLPPETAELPLPLEGATP